MSAIDRIRYYDGEFLRAFDFGDEQTYHMEMRRRLNRYLHLYGIVQGLNLVAQTSAGVTQVSIMPGFAIDAFGREIYVFAPYTLGDNEIIANRITVAGTYDVWIRYQKTASTPPSAGYSACNQTNQYTRWVESFSLVLLASPSSPFTDPAFTDDDTDDPTQDQVGVLLGTVFVDPTSATATFSQPLFDPARCVLIGAIAQRIQIPPAWDATQPQPGSQFQPFNFWNQNVPVTPNTPLNPPASLEIEPNVFLDQNLIVGPDFVLSSTPTTNISITPTQVSTPGSVKVAGDLFVQGNIYSPTTPSPGTQKWSGLSALVPQLVTAAAPDILVDRQVIAFPATMPADPGPVSSFTQSAILTTSRLSAIAKIIPIAFVVSSTFDTSIPQANDFVELSVDSVTSSILANATQCTVTASWTAGPVHAGKCAFKTFTIFFIAVCFSS